MERKTDAAKRGGGFLSNKLFETIREREREEGGRPPFRRHSFLLLLLLLVGRSLVISIEPTLRLSSKCQSLVSRF